MSRDFSTQTVSHPEEKLLHEEAEFAAIFQTHAQLEQVTVCASEQGNIQRFSACLKTKGDGEVKLILLLNMEGLEKAREKLRKMAEIADREVDFLILTIADADFLYVGRRLRTKEKEDKREGET